LQQTVIEALNPPFCKTDVSTSPFFSVVFVRYHLCLSWCVGLVALLLFFDWLCAVGKTANVPPNALANYLVLA